ncbi:MAG: hypothetical protein NTU60_07565 [Candidatus Aminicenantes bacterium]|nr:hypothetical protein [Candidatus Aminicenantes bacterium]
MLEDKALQKKAALIIIALVFLFSLGFSLFINLPAIDQNFLFADQAVYYALTQSIAHDFDMEYTKKDLARYYHDFDAGPQGIFLKKAQNGKIFFAKSWAYSLFAAPFVRMFGYNGFLVFHSFLLLIVMLLGFAYFSRANSPLTSISYLLTFLMASVAGVYFIWISPDFFNFCLAFIIVFLWIYKIKRRDAPPHSNPAGVPNSFLLSPGSDYLAVFLVGIAVFSKPPNIVLLGPLVLYALYEKKFFKALGLAVIFFLTIGLLFGANYFLTSDWNYQGGERKTFIGHFPLEKDNLTFDNLGDSMTSENYFQRFLIPAKFIPYNIFYYFFGRFTGIAWYFFPAFLALLLFFRAKRRFHDWLTLAALAGGILIYIVLTPEFYGGGGGTLANRYFLNIYPLFLFLPAEKKSWRQVALIWIVAAVFISPILVSPFRSSAQPATHAKKFPIKALPLEMTQVNNFPTNTNPDAFRIHIWPDKPEPQREFLHFLDDNFYVKIEPTGIWTRGDKTCEFILKTYYPLREVGVRLLNNPRNNNEITVKVEGMRQKIILQSKEWGILRFPVGNGFQVEQRYHYRIKIKAAKGAIPYLENQASLERRYLGVFFELDLVPKK